MFAVQNWKIWNTTSAVGSAGSTGRFRTTRLRYPVPWHFSPFRPFASPNAHTMSRTITADIRQNKATRTDVPEYVLNPRICLFKCFYSVASLYSADELRYPLLNHTSCRVFSYMHGIEGTLKRFQEQNGRWNLFVLSKRPIPSLNSLFKL
jgi:hypothetical protein